MGVELVQTQEVFDVVLDSGVNYTVIATRDENTASMDYEVYTADGDTVPAFLRSQVLDYFSKNKAE